MLILYIALFTSLVANIVSYITIREDGKMFDSYEEEIESLYDRLEKEISKIPSDYVESEENYFMGDR